MLKNKQIVGKKEKNVVFLFSHLLKMGKSRELQKGRSFSSFPSVAPLGAFKNGKTQDFSSKFFKSECSSLFSLEKRKKATGSLVKKSSAFLTKELRKKQCFFLRKREKQCFSLLPETWKKRIKTRAVALDSSPFFFSVKKKKCNFFFEAQALNFYSSDFCSFSSINVSFFKSKVQKSNRRRIILNNLISGSIKALRSGTPFSSLFFEKKRSIVDKQAGFRFLRNSTIDWHCTKPLARNQLGLWFSFMVQPFSTRKHWWILLPSQNLLFRLRWETSGKLGAKAPNFYSLKDFVESNNVNVAHLNWFSEKPFYFYVIVPFLGCLGLIYASSLNSFREGPTQKTSQTLLNSHLSSKIDRQFLGEKKLDFVSDFDFNPIFEDKISWETLNYLNYKKNLLDMCFKHLQKTNLYHFLPEAKLLGEDCFPERIDYSVGKTHDKIVYELSSTWFNYVQEKYIGTYAKTTCYDNYLNSSTLFQNLPCFFPLEKKSNFSFLKENSSNIDSFLTPSFSKKTMFDPKSSFDLREFLSERFLLKKNKWKEKNSFIKPLQSQIFEFWWTQKNLSQIYSTINSTSKGSEKTRLEKETSARLFLSLSPDVHLFNVPQLKFSSFNKLKKQKKLNFFLKGVFKNSVFEKQGPFSNFSIWENYLSQKSKIQWFWYKWCLNDSVKGQDKTSRNLLQKVIGHSNYKIHLLPFFEEKKGKTIVQRKTSSIQNTKIKSLFFNDEFAQKLFSGNLSVPKNYLSSIQNPSNFLLPFDSQVNTNAIIKLDNHYSFNLKKFNNYKKEFSEERFSSLLRKKHSFLSSELKKSSAFFLPKDGKKEKLRFSLLRKKRSFLSSELKKSGAFFLPKDGKKEKLRFSLPFFLLEKRETNLGFDSLILINGLKSKTNNRSQETKKKDFKETKIKTKPVEFYGLFGRNSRPFKNNFNYMSGSTEFFRKNPISVFSFLRKKRSVLSSELKKSSAFFLPKDGKKEKLRFSLPSLASAFSSSELYSFQSFSDYFTAAFFFDNVFYKFFLDNKKVNFLKSNSLFLSKNANKMELNSTIKTGESSSSGLSTIFSPKKLNFPILLSGSFFPLKKKECSSLFSKEKRKKTNGKREKHSFSLLPGTCKKSSAQLEIPIPPYFLDWKKDKNTNDFSSMQKNSFTKVFLVPRKKATLFSAVEKRQKNFQNKQETKLAKASFVSPTLINNFMHPDRQKSTSQSNKLKWKSPGKWSFYWNYFYHFYGSSTFFKPWSSMFDSTNRNKHSQLFFKKILSPFSGLNNFTGQNIFFKKWHSKKKEGFFYKRITKLEFKNPDLNPAKYSRVVSLLWGFRSKYKLDEVLQYQKSKYYQSKKAQQTANQNIDQNSIDSKINKQIVIKTLNKRRRYKRYLELDVVSSWLRDILYFRKMCRKLVPIKKDSYLFTINTMNQNFDFLKRKNTEGQKERRKVPVEKNRWELEKATLFPSFSFQSPFSNTTHLLLKKRKNSFFNILERNHECFPVNLKKSYVSSLRKKVAFSLSSSEKGEKIKTTFFSSFSHFFLRKNQKNSGVFLSKIIKKKVVLQKPKSDNTSKKLFLSLKKFIRVKNLYKTRYSPVVRKVGREKRSFLNNKIEMNNYTYFSNSLLFNNTPVALKKICLNFSNKRLLKINWKKKFIQKSGEFRKIKKVNADFSFKEIFSSLFKNLNRFFIYLKKTISRQLFLQVNNLFYSGKNSFLVKNESYPLKKQAELFLKPGDLENRRENGEKEKLRFRNKFPSFSLSKKKATLFFREKKKTRKQSVACFSHFSSSKEKAQLFPKFPKASLSETFFFPRKKKSDLHLSSVSNLVKININRSFSKKVSTFSTTINKPSSLSFNFFSERKFSGNFDFLFYRKNKRMRNEKGKTDQTLFPLSFYGFRDRSFEELMTKFKNLSSSFVIWRNKFQIRRDYLLLSYIYLDYLGALVNIFSPFSNKKSSYCSERTHFSLDFNNHLAKNSFNSLEIFKNEQKYLLSAQHYKSNCLKPVWSFSIVNHLKTNHLAVYEQLTNFSEELKSFNKKPNNIEKRKKGESLSKEAGKTAGTFSTFPSELSPILDLSQSSFPQFSQSLGGEDLILHRSIKNSKDFGVFSSFSEGLLLPFRDSATYNKNYLHHKNNILKRKLVLLKNQQKYLFAVNFFKNKAKYRRKSGIYNSRIVNKQTKIYNGLFLSNPQVGLKHNELILSNISNNNFNAIKINFSQIKVLTFWLCTLLFHVCLISSLLTSYKSSIHFGIKTLYSSLFVLNKYFVYTKYRIKRLINYIYQNNFEYLIETTSKYFSLFKPSRVVIFNSLKFPDSFIQLESIKENITIGWFKKSQYLNKISLKKINFSQLFFLPYYFSLRKSSHKNRIKRRDFYFSSFSSKILALFQYVQYKYQTPLTTLKSNFFGLGKPQQKSSSFFLEKSTLLSSSEKTLKNNVKLKNFQSDPKISTVMSPFSFSLLNSNKENSSSFFSSKFNLNLFEKKQLNLLKTNLTEKLSSPSKEKNLKVYFKVLQWNMLITLLIGESEVLAELEPYREMHWYFLKKFPIFLRTSSGKDYLSMSDYQADEKIRIIKQKIRQTIMILYLRSRKYESKLQNPSKQSEKKMSHLLKNRLNQKKQKTSSSLKVQKQLFSESGLLKEFSESENKNIPIQESSFSSLQKLVKTVFNFFYSLSIFSQEKKIRRQKIKKLSAWKSILTFLGKYSFVTRSAILNKRFRESLMLFSQPLVSFGPIGTIFIPYGIKNFLLRFDQIDYQKQKDRKGERKKSYAFFPFINSSIVTPRGEENKHLKKGLGKVREKLLYMKQNKLEDFSHSSYLEKLNFYIMGKLNKEFTLDSDSLSFSLEKRKKEPILKLDSSPLFELEFLTNLQKLIKKYNRVYYGFNHMKMGKRKVGKEREKRSFSFFQSLALLPHTKNLELTSTIDSSDYSSFLKRIRNLSTKNVKTIITESNLYDWTYSDSSNRLGKNSSLTQYFDTFDPKLRYYRFSTNFSKGLSDVGGLYTNFSAHQELGPLICKVYTGLFSNDKKSSAKALAFKSAKNYLLVSGPTNNESVLFLVQALAAEIGMKLFMEDAKRLQRIGRRGINKATKRLEKLFDIAQANVPALVFIEDIHVIGSKTKMVKVDEEQDDVEILARSLLSKLVYRKYHKNKSLREAFIDQNLLTGGSAVLRRRSLKPTNPIPKSLVLYQLTRRRAYSNFFKSQDNASRKINTKLFLTKKLSPAFTTNAVLIWKLFKSKIATPNKRIKESPWFHIPVDAMRSIHPLTYSIRVKVAKITLLAIFTMGTRLRLVKDLIRLFEKTHYNSHQNFIVFATTNKLSTLDPSLRRPGRLEEIISLYSLTGVSTSSRSPAFMSVLDTFKVYLKNVPGFSKTFNLIDNTLFSSTLNLKEWSLINYLAEASYYSFYSSKNSLSNESNSLNTVDFYQNLLESEEKRELKNGSSFLSSELKKSSAFFLPKDGEKEKLRFSFPISPISPFSHLTNKALKYFIFSSLNFHSGSNDSFENKNFIHMESRFHSEKNEKKNGFFQREKLQIKRNFLSKTVTPRQLKKQRMTSFETKSKVNAAFSANLFTSQNSNSSNNSDYWQLIFSNITLQRKKGGFDFSNNFSRLNKEYSKNKNIYFNNRYKQQNKSNLFITLAYSRSGQSLISFLLNYKKSLEQKTLTSNSSFLFFDSDYLTNLQLWPETVNINSLKPQNTFYNRRKNLQSYFLRFFSSKVGELLFTNSIVWNLGASATPFEKTNSLTDPTGNDSKNYILDQGGKVGALVPGFSTFLNNIYGITPDWTCAYSYIKNVVTTSSLYSKTPLISKLLRLEDVSKPRQKQFFESLNAGMLFEYSDFHYRAFFKKNNLSTEENLNLLISQKYMLNNQGRPLRKYVKLENSNRLWLFRVLYTELGTLDNISLRPTSMNYYYRNKIILKQSLKLSSYQWWNWHLRKPLEQLEDVQEIAYFPCENKYYNPRHRRWILTNGFWGYWFSFDKNFYFDLYEQSMFQSFHIAYLHLDQNREILDYLSKLYICREKLSETDLILSFKRYKI